MLRASYAHNLGGPTSVRSSLRSMACRTSSAVTPRDCFPKPLRTCQLFTSICKVSRCLDRFTSFRNVLLKTRKMCVCDHLLSATPLEFTQGDVQHKRCKKMKFSKIFQWIRHPSGSCRQARTLAPVLEDLDSVCVSSLGQSCKVAGSPGL